MNHDKVMKDAAILAHEMQKMLLKKVKNKDMEYLFKFSSYMLGSLIAGFVDAVILNSHPDIKLKLVEDMMHMTKMLLAAKDKIRDSNLSSPH